jgi:hypothetical protein
MLSTLLCCAPVGHQFPAKESTQLSFHSSHYVCAGFALPVVRVTQAQCFKFLSIPLHSWSRVFLSGPLWNPAVTCCCKLASWGPPWHMRYWWVNASSWVNGSKTYFMELLGSFWVCTRSPSWSQIHSTHIPALGSPPSLFYSPCVSLLIPGIISQINLHIGLFPKLCC